MRFGYKTSNEEYTEPKQKLIRINIPEHLYREMKMICAKRDLSQREYLSSIVIESIMGDKKR